MNLDKDELSLASDSAVALSPTEGQLETLISEVNHLNTYLTQSVSRFGEQVQNYGDRLTNLENRFRSAEGQKSGHESENSRPESEAQEAKSKVSDAGDTIGVVSETDSLLCSMRREEAEDQSMVTRNLLAELSPELTNVLSLANCVTVFRLASLYELKDLSDAAQGVICKNLKEILKVPTGKVSAASGTSLIPGSVSEEQGVPPQYPVSAGSLNPGCTLDHHMSEVNQSNAFMGTVAHSVTGLEDRFQATENSLQDQNKRLEGQENRLAIQNRMFDKEIRDLESQVSSSGNLGQLISQFTRVMTLEQCLKTEYQNKELEDQVNQLRNENKKLERQSRKLEDQNQGLELCNRKLEEQNTELKDQNKMMEDQMKKLENQTSKLEELNRGLEDQARKLKDQDVNLEEQIQGLKSDVQELKTRNPDSVKEKMVDIVTSQSASRTSGRDVLFVMGGYDKVDTMETLDPTVGCWVSHKIPDAPSGVTWIGSVGHKILVLEWRNKRFRSLDVQTREWTKLQYLPQHRDFYTVAASGDQVYVMGGEKEPYGTRCDRYHAQTDCWGETAPMREGRGRAASVCHAGKIYCSGGRSVTGGFYLSCLEVLDPQQNDHWASLPPMGLGRTHHCLASCGRFLWVIGGYDGKTRISDVEKYDVEGQQWSRVTSLGMPRCVFSASVIGGRVHVIGGEMTGLTHARVRTVQVYDEEKDHWSFAAPLHKERNWHGSCLVCSLPDAVADNFAVLTE